MRPLIDASNSLATTSRGRGGTGNRVRLPALVCWLALIGAAPVWGDDPKPALKQIALTGIADWQMTADGVTLIVSQPKTAQLLYFDTVKQQQVKAVELEFAPERLALQGETLYASVRGAAIVHALDPELGTSRARYKLPGEPIVDLKCRREGGPVFAANMREEVFAIEPQPRSFQKTQARGTMLAVDPLGRFLLVGTNRPATDFVEVQRDGQTQRLRLVTLAGRASVWKHAIEKDGLRLVAANPNTALGAGGSLAINSTGTRFSMTAGGGWRSQTDQRYHYVAAVFETEDMTTRVGQVEIGAYPQAIAFHPKLKLGVAVQRGVKPMLRVFKSTSLVERQAVNLRGQGLRRQQPNLLAFGNRGATLWHHAHDTLTIVPLELSDEERGQLESPP